MACAECRRLKIRCDRTVPCSTCVKRGCDMLCPNSSHCIPQAPNQLNLLPVSRYTSAGRWKSVSNTDPGLVPRVIFILSYSFALVAAEHLHKKIARLEARMHCLEDAVSIIHGTTSSDGPHPLLIPTKDDKHSLKPVTEDPSALADTLGSLHIDRGGGARFFGPSGGAEVCRIGPQLH